VKVVIRHFHLLLLSLLPNEFIQGDEIKQIEFYELIIAEDFKTSQNESGNQAPSPSSFLHPLH
jgi:hypothetical protein